jgi:hypothetical protein
MAKTTGEKSEQKVVERPVKKVLRSTQHSQAKRAEKAVKQALDEELKTEKESLVVRNLPKLYDVVYIVKESQTNEELRYSIRSVVKNFPVRNIWIFGYRPLWLKGVINVYIPQGVDKWSNSKELFKRISECKSLPDEFVLFNDDFFVMEKVEEPKLYYSGLLLDRINELDEKFGSIHPLYAKNLRMVYDRLLEYKVDEPKSYAVHKPMMFNRAMMAWSLHLTEDLPMSLRSFYANYYNLGGVDAPDCKVFSLRPDYHYEGEYLSTDDRTFRLGKVGRDIRAEFSEPSEFEIIK